MKHILIALFLTVAGGAQAVQPDEILENSLLESTARDISQGLRCPVCQNENIDDSNAAISRDLRILVRDLLLVGYLDALIAEINTPAMDPTIAAAQRDIMASLDVANDDFLIDEPYIARFLDDAENAGLDIGALIERADDRFVSANPKQSVTNYVVDKYGEYVLLKPQADGANIILWIAPIAVLLLAMMFGTLAIRRKPAPQSGLTDAEKARLDEILKS